MTSGADDPFVAITEGRGVTVGDGLTYHSLDSWGVSRYSANTIDNNRGFVTSAVMSARLSRGWPFSHDEDDLDSHKFKFSIEKPWFLSSIAVIIYIVILLGLIFFEMIGRSLKK